MLLVLRISYTFVFYNPRRGPWVDYSPADFSTGAMGQLAERRPSGLNRLMEIRPRVTKTDGERYQASKTELRRFTLALRDEYNTKHRYTPTDSTKRTKI